MKITELLAPMRERLEKAIADVECGNDRPIKEELAKLIAAVECLSEGYAEMLEHLCDSRSDLPCSQMWFQDVADERLAQAEEILK